MALETGTYISDLVSTNPTSSDAKSQGDDHLRFIKSAVKATFPNVTGAVTPTHTELNFVDGVTSAIQTQLDALTADKATIASPTFTGTALLANQETSGTAIFTGTVTINGSLDMNAGTGATITGLSTPSGSTDAATKGYVDTQLSNLIASAPGMLDTLDELAAALGDDANFAATTAASIATKLALAGGTMSGVIDMGAQKITNLATPTASSDAVRLDYVTTLYGSTASAAASAVATAADAIATAADRVQTGLDRTAAAASAAVAAGAAAFMDTNPVVKGSVDATKQVRFEVDGLTTATTRVLTVPDADLTLVGADTAQTLTNKTLTGYTETVYALSGTVIDAANGTVQTKTLAANTTFTESLADGQSVILGITAGAYSVTWPTTTWAKVGGSGTAPTLVSTGVNWITLWQVGGTLYGSFLGTT